MKNKENKLVQAFENWWVEYAPDKTEKQAKAAFIAALDTVFINEDEIQYRALPYFTNTAKEDWLNYINRRELLNFTIPTANSNTPKFSPFPLTFEIIDLVCGEVMKEKQSSDKNKFNITSASEARKILDNRLGDINKSAQIALDYINNLVIEASKAGKNKCVCGTFGFKDCQPLCFEEWPKFNKLVWETLTKNGYNCFVKQYTTTGNALIIEW